MTQKKENTESSWIDPDDAPELTKEWFEKADVYHGDVLISRGRPAGSGKKSALTIRFDDDVIEAFRAKGKGWQTAMNQALRDWLKTH